MKKNQINTAIVKEEIIEEGTSTGQEMRIVKSFDIFPGTDSITTYDIPVGGKVLSITGIYDNIKMWVLCDPSAPIEKRVFRTYPSNTDIYFKGTTSLRYIGTGTTLNNNIFHLFEVLK